MLVSNSFLGYVIILCDRDARSESMMRIYVVLVVKDDRTKEF